jgi:hypothetical protein
MQPFESASAGRGRTRVHARIYEVGGDLLAVLSGEGAHIGAATIAEAIPGETGRVATVSARGHREAELTEYLSEAICSATGRRTVAIAGVHLDRITVAEIESIRRNVRKLVGRLDFDRLRRGTPEPRTRSSRRFPRDSAPRDAG